MVIFKTLTMQIRFNAATALSPQEAFRAKVVTPQRFLHELADFMCLMFGESLSGYIRKDDSSFYRKLNQPREIRYKRLVSVLRAYNLFPETVRHPQVLRFVNGDFFDAGQITAGPRHGLVQRETVFEQMPEQFGSLP